MHSHGQYELLGRTRDDAAGEAFDKVARVLGLDYPGGPAIQKMARQAEEELGRLGKPLALARNTYRLPRAWLRGTYDFSFSGLKTAVLQLAEGASESQHPGAPDAGRTGGKKQVSRYTRMGISAQKSGVNVPLLAASFQEAVVDMLAVKTRMAAQEYQVRQVLLAGGVAANIALRARLEQELLPLHIRLNYPPIVFCTDNAAMIASAAFFHLLRGEQHGLDLDVHPGLSLPLLGESR
jgi:N6-L-threonylcarbamoyladenine synthase